ncbi:MAG: OmpA family protein, partial [Archangium sp.]|nr:OmpA family protein [Archangium sp.]
ISDLAEGASRCTDATGDSVCDGPDTDRDGIVDSADGTTTFGDTASPALPDTDADGLPDLRDLDSDDDGVSDRSEGPSGCTDATADGVCDGTDGDGDGLIDSADGNVTGFGDRTEPNPADTDGDGAPDFRDLDSDNDGVSDLVEGKATCADADANSVCDGDDADGDGVRSSGDGAPAAFGAPGGGSTPDTDGDGAPDFRDLDSDNDGLSDLVEGGSGCADSNRDAVCDGTDTDKDGLPATSDGQPTRFGGTARPRPDTDGDGVPDFRDLDSDNDGRSDLIEGGSGCTDADTNGVCDGLDPDGDGIVESADHAPTTFGNAPKPDTTGDLPDADSDGTPDFRDTQSDGKNFDVDPRLDADRDGVIDQVEDADGDGIADLIDSAPGVFGGLPPVSASALTVGGGGCGCTEVPGAPVAALAFALLRFRRRLRRSHATALTVALALFTVFAGSPALAQTEATSTAVDVQLYKPGIGRFDVQNALSPQTCGHQCWNLGLLFQYALNPLVLKDANGGTRVGRLVDHQLTADLYGSLGIFERFELGVHLPLYIQSAGSSPLLNARYVGEGWIFGAGDLRLLPRVRIATFDSGITVGFALPIVLPTGRTDAFMGGGFLAAQPRALVEYQHSHFRLDANLGINLRRQEMVANVSFGNEFTWAVAGEVPFTVADVPFAVSGVVHGLVGFNGTKLAENRPTEADVGLKATFGGAWVVSAGVGRGIISGYGAPDVRGLVGIGYAPTCGPATPRDSDGDGLLDDVDACPAQPEDRDGFEDTDGCPDLDDDTDGVPDTTDSCRLDPEDRDTFEDGDGCPDPDNDKDGVPDVKDRCALVPETVNGFEDTDGCPDEKPLVDTDGDGLLDNVDRCPTQAEDKDTFEDGDGCPDVDNDKDGILDTVDKCPLVPETINGTQDDDGCPDQGESKVRLEAGRILILEKVYFATNKDLILDRSFKLLKEVASTMRAHPELVKVRVEGHTDSVGNDQYNLELSQRRAESVKRFLEREGIAPERLEAKGYGELKPVAGNTTPADREKNRRVEFIVVDTPSTAPEPEGALR